MRNLLILKLFILTFTLSTFSVQLHALNLKFHEVNWQSVLELDRSQQQQIDTIKNHYREQQKNLRESSEHCLKPEILQQQAEQLQQSFTEEVRAVLTPSQQTKANKISQNLFSKMHQQQVQKVAQALGLSPSKKLDLIEAARSIELQYQWPIDIYQRDQSQAELDRIINQALTEEQKALLQLQRKQALDNWQNYEDFDFACMPI